MPYITHIHVEHCRNVRRIDIDLAEPRVAWPQPFRHLILTGPNGSGKSGVLEMVAEEIQEAVRPRDLQMRLFVGEENAVRWDCDSRDIPSAFANGDFIAAYQPARRGVRTKEVHGPSKWKRRKLSDVGVKQEGVSTLHQFMVNKHVQMTYAASEGDRATAERVEAWLTAFENHLRRIAEDDELSMLYDSDAFAFRFRRGDGYIFDLNTLADGHAAVLALLAELLIRVDLVQSTRRDFTFEPDGIIIVDEIETHLHPSLQEQVLPFLTDLFPRFQFIVATHSPAVIASVPNAVVYDIKKRTQTLSDRFRGVRYGTLMTEHFGISSEIDLDSTEKLVRLRELSSILARTTDEETEFNSLAEELSGRSRTLAVEVWMIREGLGKPTRETTGRKQ